MAAGGSEGQPWLQIVCDAFILEFCPYSGVCPYSLSQLIPEPSKMPSQSTAQSETQTKGQTYENHSEHIGSEEIIIDPGTGCWSHRNPVFTDSTA